MSVAAVTATAPLPDIDVLQALGLSATDFDEHNHLRDAQRWSPGLMQAMAASAGVPLTDGLRWLVSWVREYHLTYGNPPLMRTVVSALRAARDDPSLSSRAVYAIHDRHPVRMACWLGGLPRPDWCI
jgi:tRNA 2-thiouridine synthesizing protein E